jgi:hypothetical protein
MNLKEKLLALVVPFVFGSTEPSMPEYTLLWYRIFYANLRNLNVIMLFWELLAI